MYKKVLQGFEKWYGGGVVLLFLTVIYGTKPSCLHVLGIETVSIFDAEVQEIQCRFMYVQ